MYCNILEEIIDLSTEVISFDDLKILLLSKNNISVKIGFDPTSSDLHLGHLVLILKLAKLQKIGCKIYVIIGDCTAMIGDPSGRNISRPFLSHEQISLNYQTYINQILKFLNPVLTSIYFNSSWYEFFNIENYIKLLSLSTVSRMLERIDFKSRFNNNTQICINEFVYPLLQAYDSVFLDVDIEFGGIDQKFNFLLGRELQKKFFQRSQIAVMMPLLLGLDGTNKMSKSLNNCINLTDNFYDIFCKIMSISDSLMKDYFIYLHISDYNDYIFLLNCIDNYMDLKLFLAFRVVMLICNIDLAILAKSRFLDIFSKRVTPVNFNEFIFETYLHNVALSCVLFYYKIVSSNSDFKRLVKNNAIEVDGVTILNKLHFLSSGLSYNIRVGKKIFVRIFLKKIDFFTK